MLDDHQQAAVVTEATRAFVMAGAGSGKTRVLVARVGRLLDLGIQPERICAITFTKAAGEEMARRLTPPGVNELGIPEVPPNFGHIGTIHSLGYRILRSQYRGRKVADTALSRRLIRRAMTQLQCTPKEWERSGEIIKRISAAKRKMRPFHRDIAHIAVAYQQLLVQMRLWDFDDLVSAAVTVLADPVKRAQWAQSYDAILVDEAQDVSEVQWELITALLRPDASLFLVGDLGQSIYGWREAVPEYILDKLPLIVGQLTVYGLPQNYRSRPEVVALANRVLAGRRGALMLIPTRESPANIEHLSVERLRIPGDHHDEAVAVLRRIKAALHTGEVESGGDVAIIARLNAQLEPFEAAAVEEGVPAIILNGRSFYARADVLDVLAYLRIAMGQDVGLSLTRIYGKPGRRVGQAFHADLIQRGGWEALLSPVTLKQLGIRPIWQAGAEKLRQMVYMLQTMVADGLTTAELVQVVYNTIGYKDWLLGDSGEGVAERTEADDAIEEALTSLLRAADRMPNPDEFLNFADQCAHRAPAARARSITLSTVHRAKGLEWPLVVVGGLVADSFPHKRGDQEEERRVFYVAITRAKERLLLSTHTNVPCSEFFEEGIDGLADTIPAGGAGPEGEPGEGGADLCAPVDAPGVDRGAVRGEPAPGEPPGGQRQGGDVSGSHLHGGRPGVAAPSGASRLSRRLAS